MSARKTDCQLFCGYTSCRKNRQGENAAGHKSCLFSYSLPFVNSASWPRIPFPPDREMLPTFSQIFSRYSISFKRYRILFSSISLAVFSRLLVEATSSLLVMTLAWACFSANQHRIHDRPDLSRKNNIFNSYVSKLHRILLLYLFYFLRQTGSQFLSFIQKLVQLQPSPHTLWQPAGRRCKSAPRYLTSSSSG